MIAFNYREVAEDLEDDMFNQEEIKDTIHSTFTFLKETIKEGGLQKGYKSVRIFNFGIFAVKKGRLEFYKKKFKNKK